MYGRINVNLSNIHVEGMLRDIIFKAIKILLILLVLLGLLVVILPKTIDFNKRSQAIIEEFTTIGLKLEINGKITAKFFPQVTLTVPNISISSINGNNLTNYLNAKKLIIEVPLYKLLLKQKGFKSIKIYEATINLDDAKDSSNLARLYNMRKNSSVEYIKIINSSSYSQSQKNSDKDYYHNINLKFKFDKNSTLITGNSTKNEINYSVNINIENSQNNDKSVLAKITSNALESTFKGNFAFIDNRLNYSGNLNSKILKPDTLLNNMSKVFPFLENAEKKYLENPINFKTDIQYNADSFTMKNINITSPDIKGNGAFSCYDSGVGNSKISANFNLDYININKFIFFNKNTDMQASGNEVFIDTISNNNVDNSYISLDFIDNADIELKLNIQKLDIKNMSLTNLISNYTTDSGQIKDSTLSFQINNDGLNSSFKLENLKVNKIEDNKILLGQFTNTGNNINKTFELFNLNDYINIQEDNLQYDVTSQIIISPFEISIFNINGSIGEGKINGNIAAKKSNIDDYKVDIKFNNLTLTNFDLPLFRSRLQSLLSDSNDPSYLSKFIWFRTLKSNYNIKLSFENSSFKKEKISNLTVLCDLIPANMTLKGLINSSFAEGNFAINLTALSIKPSLDINVEGKRFNYDLFSTLMLESFQNKATAPNNQGFWSDQKIDVFRLNKYTANLDLDIKNLLLHNQNYTNVKGSARTVNDALYLDNLALDAWGGNLQAQGNVSFFDKLLYQLSFVATNIESSTLLQSLSPKLNAFTGPIAMNGSIVMEGNSPKELVSNLSMTGNVIGSLINLKGIDSDAIVDLVLEREKISQNKVLDTLSTLSSSGSSDITNLQGSFIVNKGVMESNNISFKTRFNSALSALYWNLKDMILSSNTQFFFLLYNNPEPMSYNIVVSGDLNKDLQYKVENAGLLKYVKSVYGIVTAEDIIEARRISKQNARKANTLDEAAEDQNYLYHKIQEQELAAKDKSEEDALLKSLSTK